MRQKLRRTAVRLLPIREDVEDFCINLGRKIILEVFVSFIKMFVIKK